MFSSINLLKKIAHSIEKNFFYKIIFFTVAAFFTILIRGYYFGTFDQTSHIPFLKKIADPSLYPNDYFFSLIKSHYSFFWYLFIPFYHLKILEPSLFIAHFFIILITFFSIWRLVKTLSNNSFTAIVSVIVFIFPHISFSGFPFFEFSFLNRTFAFPFLILAFDYYLRRKYWLSYFILGLLFNLHALSASFVFVMIIFDNLNRLRKIGVKTTIINLLIFLISALPVLIWRIIFIKNTPLFNQQWYYFIANFILSNIFKPLNLNPPYIFLTFAGIVSIFLFFHFQNKISWRQKTVVKNFIIINVIFLVIHFLSSYFFPLTFIIQFQLIRIGIFITFFSYLAAITFFTEEIIKKRVIKIKELLLFLVGLFSPSPLFLSFCYLSYRLKKGILFSIIFFTLTSVFGYYLAFRWNIWQPSINITSKGLKSYQVQIWAKNNTKKDDIFIVPPHLWHFYQLDWRVISERTPVVLFSELLEAAFEPQYIAYWQKRFNDIAPNAMEKFTNNPFENLNIAKNAFYSNTENKFLALAAKYQARYLVVEKPYSYNFPQVYEDDFFRVYRLN